MSVGDDGGDDVRLSLVKPMTDEQVPEQRLSPDGLGRAQRRGDACASCAKRWPRPRRPLGRLDDGTVLYVCDQCAPGLEMAQDESRGDSPAS
ncbi:hypothetical protein [Actinocorallia sp. A-T 12471]|uniref:hypothetical protein n=1 Tax=Actinocorallia sp. A-T 12471 TaxID=3089813 RepID=UPI0029CAF8CC|nr:hypothetical protein [Actinocorallia sp. A-T 12471]MDX6738519.1 hypothetical protein [Actinocorallia sp. A-T 12471]